MFAAAANPYDELITKATDENLASEDWALNLEVCDKVGGEGQPGARNAVGALQKRLAHRNPSVQLYALELANTLAQNCGKTLLEELSSRNWTGALDRLVNDRTTAAPVKKKALVYIKAWAKQFEDTGDPNLGIMGELYDQLRAKNLQFEEPEPTPESVIDARQRAEDEELQRVLELSKQDKGGRATLAAAAESAAASGGSSSRPQPTAYTPQPAPIQATNHYVPPPAPEPEPAPAPLDIQTATRVRALYTFTSTEVGELKFERGDVIKVLDRGFKEWWRGACNGKIGIFPVTYVEAMQEQSPRELQEEAQEEARVFASLGLVDQLLQTLREIDPTQGQRLDDRPEIEEMYQASVGLQGQINALIKKYSDQKAELEHMNANFLRAMKQYEELRNPPPPAQYGYAPQHDPYGAQQPPYQQQPQHLPQAQYAAQPPYGQQTDGQPPYPRQPEHQYSGHEVQQPQQPFIQQPDPYQYAQHPGQPPAGHNYPQQSPPVATGSAPGYGVPGEVAPGQQFYHQNGTSQTSLQRAPTGAPDLPPQSPQRQHSTTQPGAAGVGSGNMNPDEHKAAWDAYYAQQRQQQQAQAGQPIHDGVPQQAYGASPYPQQQLQRAVSGAGSVEGVTGGLNRMTVHGQ